MVANQPIERPGSVDFLVNQLNAVAQQSDEQTRQSKFPLVVSHQDPASQARVVDFQVVPGVNGSGAVLSVYDGAQHLVLGTDPDTGYGLSQPQTQVPMYPTNPGLIFNSSTTWASYYTGQVQQNNSCFLAQWRMNNSWGGTGAASVVASYVKIYDSVTGWNWTSPTVTSGSSTTTSPGVLTTCGPYSVQVPQSSIGNLFGIDIYSQLVSGGASSSIAVTPLSMIGCALAFALPWLGGTPSS
ncbi:hypothetical protein ATK30_6863 [Amycolatopsis echigonensis]|uniref:Uncharacterized protein n=1 Tax=Amycolatopsis echigonensis TaxID=2576905 RepID=A0A2N3WQ03_9PSEU|nr:hypothetical protein [Amycolatopsis niigatensis]PKV95930.1 hypothetical protein ATK30_6863 [Amycolatopsis niigatensis]